MRKNYAAPQLPTKKSSVESIDIALVRAESASIQRHKEETRAELEAIPHVIAKARQEGHTQELDYCISLRETIRYYEGHLNALRKILEGQFKPEE